MKKKNILLIMVLTSISILSMFSMINLSSAAPLGFEQQTFQIEAQNQNSFQFQQQTRINITSEVDIEGTILCESLKIENKDFVLEITSAEGDMNLNMTCTEEQAELGLLNGERITARNRNRLRYQEGFCICIDANCSEIQARLRIKATEQNKDGTWAYYNETSEEWITSPTTVKDGYLETITDHFSYWTIFISEQDFTILYVGIGATVIILLGVIGFIYYKKR
ncbi:MAG: hypothetical protein JXA99_03075 [Candidatus Lokiarchaeota archaeon]|nr:hypothetical protein [Candidatus Lokiarchaeota archaeon]